MESGEKCYAVMAENEIRMESSAGGVFTMLAETILDEGGAVCGAVLNSEFKTEHVIIRQKRDLPPLRGAKYVESDLKNCFQEIKDLLKNGTKVLFTGTPCQVKKIKDFLGEEENLLTMDMICHGVIPPEIFKKYLNETYNVEDLKYFKFTTKYLGYNDKSCVAVFKSGQKLIGYPETDPFEKGYHNSLLIKKECSNCAYAPLPHAGDFTVGNFWGVERVKKELNDNKGTSVVILNTEKAERYFEKIKEKAKKVEAVPIENAIPYNRYRSTDCIHGERDRCYEMLEKNSVHKSVDYCIRGHYDVGMLGVWFGCNYGSIATYYGLKKILEDMGLSVLMIDKPGFVNEDVETNEKNHSRIFAKEHFHVSRRYPLHEMKQLNEICDSFVIGSDQVWNQGISRNFGRSFLMDFVDEEKKKVAVAASFGHAKDFRDERERQITAHYLKQFDAIGVREKSAVDICRDRFQVEATRVLDPVFAADSRIYDEIADQARFEEKEPYILTYILDPTPEKKEAIRYMEKQLGMKSVHMLDGLPWTYEENRKKMEDMGKVLEDVSFAEWLNYFRKSSYVITDSCHGMSFAIIYKKAFAGIGNARRGITRFTSLTEVFQVQDRLVLDPLEIIQKPVFLEPVNYNMVDRIMKAEKARTLEWIHEAMFSSKQVKKYQSYEYIVKEKKKEDWERKEKKKEEPSLSHKIYVKIPVTVKKAAKKIIRGDK